MSHFKIQQRLSLKIHKRTESEDQISPTQTDVQMDIQHEKEMGGQLHKFHQANSENDLLYACGHLMTTSRSTAADPTGGTSKIASQLCNECDKEQQSEESQPIDNERDSSEEEVLPRCHLNLGGSTKYSEGGPFLSLNFAADVVSNSNNFSSYTITIEAPENATKEEIEIHELLDSLQISKVNVKKYLEEQQRIESPEVRKAFDELNSRQSSCYGGDSVKSIKSPSFLQKRMNKFSQLQNSAGLQIQGFKSTCQNERIHGTFMLEKPLTNNMSSSASRRAELTGFPEEQTQILNESQKRMRNIQLAMRQSDTTQLPNGNISPEILNSQYKRSPSPLCQVKISNFQLQDNFTLQPERIQSDSSDQSSAKSPVEINKKTQSQIVPKTQDNEFVTSFSTASCIFQGIPNFDSKPAPHDKRRPINGLSLMIPQKNNHESNVDESQQEGKVTQISNSLETRDTSNSSLANIMKQQQSNNQKDQLQQQHMEDEPLLKAMLSGLDQRLDMRTKSHSMIASSKFRSFVSLTNAQNIASDLGGLDLDFSSKINELEQDKTDNNFNYNVSNDSNKVYQEIIRKYSGDDQEAIEQHQKHLDTPLPQSS